MKKIFLAMLLVCGIFVTQQNVFAGNRNIPISQITNEQKAISYYLTDLNGEATVISLVGNESKQLDCEYTHAGIYEYKLTSDYTTTAYDITVYVSNSNGVQTVIKNNNGEKVDVAEFVYQTETNTTEQPQETYEVNTGDNSNIMLYTILLISAVGVVVFVLRKNNT